MSSNVEMQASNMMRNLVEKYEEAIIGDFDMGSKIFTIQEAFKNNPEEFEHIGMLIGYFASARSVRFVLSTDILNESGFIEGEREMIRDAWKHFGGTIDLFDLNVLQHGHDFN